MRQFVYFSTAAGRQDAAITGQILATSRKRNLADDITGLLVAGGHRYLQVIEGPEIAVQATTARIRRDPRHQSMTVLVDRAIKQRDFDGWSMAFREEPELGDFAIFEDLVEQMCDHIVEPALRERIKRFSQSFATAPLQFNA